MIGGLDLPKKNSLTFSTTVFKNKPFVRCENIIYYGNVSDSYIIKLEILSEKTAFNTVVADKISVQLLNVSSSELGLRKKIIKKCEKNGLYEAMDIAEAWLNKALDEQ